MKKEDNVISITRNPKNPKTVRVGEYQEIDTRGAPPPTREQLKRMWRESLNFEQPVAPNVTRVDGARGLVTKCLIEILEDCVGDYEMDYEELTVADLFEYLVDWQEASQKRNQRR